MIFTALRLHVNIIAGWGLCVQLQIDGQREELLERMALIEVPQELLTSLQTGLLGSFLGPRFRYASLVCLPHPQNVNIPVGPDVSLPLLMCVFGTSMIPACDQCLRDTEASL